jgi:subtilisin-like proprotein convertase family protein
MKRATNSLCRRTAMYTALVAMLPVLGTGRAALAQKVGFDCAADGGTNCTELIPDGGSLASTVTIPGACSPVARVCVALGVEHSEMSDLTITLSHNMVSVPIAAATSPDLQRGQIFESEFDGLDGAGTWTLTLADAMTGDYGALNNWALGLCCGANCGNGLVRVNPTTGLVTTEAGGTAQFSVELTCPPFHNVTIPSIASSDSTEGVANASSLSFTSGNWTVPQMVTATGQDDALLDGDVPYAIPLGIATLGARFAPSVVPADLYDPPSLYAGVNPADVALINLDDETDLAIKKTLVTSGPPVIYSITASNHGLGTVIGATVIDNFPAGLICSWTCTAAAGATCTAGPVAGNINDSVNLPPGISVTYTATCTIGSGSQFINSASIVPPAGVHEIDPRDNGDTAARVALPAPAPAPALSMVGVAIALLLLAGIARRRFLARLTR